MTEKGPGCRLKKDEGLDKEPRRRVLCIRFEGVNARTLLINKDLFIHPGSERVGIVFGFVCRINEIVIRIACVSIFLLQ